MRPSILKPLSFAAFLIIAGCDFLSPFGDDAPADEKDLVWVETMPVQCLGNPWQQEWLKEHGNKYEEYPQEQEQEILKLFFLKRGAVVYASNTAWVWEATCLACSCPAGYAQYLKVHKKDLPVFEEYGFQISGANLKLQMDKSAFAGDEAVTFKLANPSSYSFTTKATDGFGLAELLVVEGSDFTVQQEQEGYWQHVSLPAAFEGVGTLIIAPNETRRGYWLNHQKLSGTFRLLLRVLAEGDSARAGYVVSESFLVNGGVTPFDPNPDSLDFGDDYKLHADSTRLQGDFLRTAVSYSGGCKFHAFEARLNRIENLTAYLFIRHNSNRDSCEAHLTTPLQSNLEPLLRRDDWDKLVLLGPGGIAIRLL